MYITQLIKSLKPRRREHWLMLSILIYSIMGVLSYYLPAPLCHAIKALCGITFIWILITKFRGNPFRGISYIAYGILFLWSIWLTFHMLFIADVRSTFTDYHGITTWIIAYFESALFLPNLMPLILLVFPRNYQFDFKYLWRIMWLMCIIYLCYYPFAFWNMTHFSWSDELVPGQEWGDAGTYGDFIQHSTIGITSIAPVVIMVFFKKYLRVKQWNWFLIAYIGGLLLTAFMARRGGVVTSLLYLALAWMMYALADKNTSFIKMCLMGVVVVGLGYMLVSGASDTFFSTLMGRLDEDTRSGVEESFYADMSTTKDWLFGRGWFGEYYDPIFKAFRPHIETGYLALILRGGLMYLIPYVTVLTFAFINGFFRSKNIFCKSFALICLMQIICLYPSGWPAFNFLHFIIWLGAWVCNSPLMRKLDDKQIKTLWF